MLALRLATVCSPIMPTRTPELNRPATPATPRASRHCSQRGKLVRQSVSPLRNVTRPETDDYVTRLRQPLDHARKILWPVERNSLTMAVRPQRLHQSVTIGACNRRFTGRIDIGNDDRVGIIEASGELLEQRSKPCIAVRLHDRDHAPAAGFACSPQHGADLYRMMAVIIDDRHTIPFSCPRETATHAAEFGERIANARVINAKLAGDGDCGCCIERVVPTRHGKL